MEEGTDMTRRTSGPRPVALAAAALITLAALTGCGRDINVAPLTATDVARLQALADPADPAYRIAPGDIVFIKFPFHAEMDQEVLVQPDGQINVSGVGSLAASGQTTREVEERVKQESSVRLRDPEVVVTVRKLGEQTVYVGGEVGRPGSLVFRKGLTPLQAIMAAGGFRDTAAVDSVILVRPARSDGQYIARKLDLERIVMDGDREAITLAPHDVLFVPRTRIANANVWVRQHITDLFPFIRVPVPPVF